MTGTSVPSAFFSVSQQDCRSISHFPLLAKCPTLSNKDIEKLQKDLDRLGKLTAENAMKIGPSKCKAVRFTRARVMDPLNYTLGDQLIPDASSCKYLGTILGSDLSWADHVKYTVKKGFGRHYIS